MPSTFQFQPYRSDAPRTVADIMLTGGAQQAAAIRASGEARARAASAIGQDAAGTISTIQQERRDAPIRALQVQNLQNETALGTAKVAAVNRAKLGQDVLATAVRQFGDDADKVVKFVSANGFSDLADGYLQTHDLLQKVRKGAIADQDSANAFEGEILSRIAKLDTPESKQAAWTAAQGSLRAHGLDTSSLSPTWDDAQAAEQIALYGPKPQLETVAPGGTVIDKNNPTAPLFTAPNPSAQETARHNSAMEAIAKLTAGRAEAAQRETERHNRAVEAETAKKDAAAASDVTQLTPEGLDAAAMMFAKTGQLPALGMGDKTTRKAIINRAAVMVPGLDVASAKADYDANRKSLDNIAGTLDTLESFSKAAGKNLDQFVELAKNLPDSGVPWANTPLRLLNDKLVGAEWAPAVNAARAVATREVARITGDPKLKGVLSDAARHEVDQLVPGDITFAQLKRVIPVIRRDMENVHGSLTEQKTAIQGRIKLGQSSSQGQSGGNITVTAPDGSVHAFATQAQADTFKSLAGIK